MTSLFEQQSCERFGPLISARIDGELESQAARQLDEHMATCGECRRRMEAFGEINELVFSAATVEPNADSVVAVELAEQKRSRDIDHAIGRRLMRWIPLAVAACVLIGLFVVALPSEKTVTAKQIAQPLAELKMINVRQLEGQARMLKTLELELRALKLELITIDDGNNAFPVSEARKNVEQKLDQLISRVGNFGTESY